MSRLSALCPSSVLAATLPVLLAGCLVPAPIDEEEVPPNYAPVFALETVTPPYGQEITYDPAVTTEPIKFEIPDITDSDADDRVYWRWFTNYDSRFSQVFASGLPNGARPVGGRTSISISIAPCTDLTAFPTRKLHRIEVLVADRPFLLDDETTVARNQSLPDDAGRFKVVWFVNFDPAACAVVP